MIVLFIILWLLAGFISVSFMRNAWYVYWYERYNEHFIDTNYFSFRDELVFGFIMTISGFIGAFIYIIDDAFDSYSNYKLSNSLWMIIYNRKKVEKHVNNLNKTK